MRHAGSHYTWYRRRVLRTSIATIICNALQDDIESLDNFLQALRLNSELMITFYFVICQVGYPVQLIFHPMNRFANGAKGHKCTVCLFFGNFNKLYFFNFRHSGICVFTHDAKLIESKQVFVSSNRSKVNTNRQDNSPSKTCELSFTQKRTAECCHTAETRNMNKTRRRDTIVTSRGGRKSLTTSSEPHRPAADYTFAH